MDSNVEILENTPTVVKVPDAALTDEFFPELANSLMPDGIAKNLENLFTQVMLTKLRVSHMVSAKPLDLTDWATQKAELFTKNKVAIQNVINQFTRNVKPRILEKFTEVNNFFNNFQLYYLHLVQELNSVKENIRQDKKIESSGYKAVLEGYLKIIADFKHSEADNPEAILSDFIVS